MEVTDKYLYHRNEMNAIRLCLVKAVCATSYQQGFKASNVKKISIDVPCTPTVFRNTIGCYVANINYFGQDSYKCTVSPSDLDHVFGRNWHCFIYRGSFTRCRIIGLISIHYRKKSTPQTAVVFDDR